MEPMLMREEYLKKLFYGNDFKEEYSKNVQ